jgi:hypothetical protein
MSVWEKILKNPRSKGALTLNTSSFSTEVKLPKRSYQLPSLFIGLGIGTTFTKRTFLCQLGAETMRWNPETGQNKTDLSVFRVEKIVSDIYQEVALGEESLSNFMSDRGDPSCTLFLQPVRFLLSETKLPSFVSTCEGQKILYQSPSNQDVYKLYVKAQLRFLWDKIRKFYSEIRRFQIGQIVVEYPDYFAGSDLKKYRGWLVEAAQEFFPPLLAQEEEQPELGDRFTMLPESVMTLLHWLTDQIESKLAAQELDLKKLMVRHGILPRTADPVHFLIVTIGATHSRVVRIRVPSLAHLASAKRVGETVALSHNYLGRTGMGGDHISCAFLEEEEERRYGATPAHRVSTFTRKVFEDWSKINSPEGKKHFEELYGEQFSKAVEKLGELALKGFSEFPENTIVILGGKVFSIPYFKDSFKEYLHQHRVPLARIVSPSSDDVSIDRVCEIIQFQQKGLGRSFVVKAGVDTEGVQRFTWKIGKVVEGTLVESVLSPDNKEWDSAHPRDFTVTLERGVRRLSLGTQKTGGGISQLWANVTLKPRITSAVQVTFRTEGPDDLKIVNVQTDAKTSVKVDDFQVDMLIAGEHPSHFPLYEKILKTGQ